MSSFSFSPLCVTLFSLWCEMTKICSGKINEIIKIIYWYWFRCTAAPSQSFFFHFLVFAFFLMHSNEWTVCVWNTSIVHVHRQRQRWQHRQRAMSWGGGVGCYANEMSAHPGDIKFEMVLQQFYRRVECASVRATADATTAAADTVTISRPPKIVDSCGLPSTKPDEL